MLEMSSGGVLDRNYVIDMLGKLLSCDSLLVFC
jgi:hypothetical protein